MNASEKFPIDTELENSRVVCTFYKGTPAEPNLLLAGRYLDKVTDNFQWDGGLKKLSNAILLMKSAAHTVGIDDPFSPIACVIMNRAIDLEQVVNSY